MSEAQEPLTNKINQTQVAIHKGHTCSARQEACAQPGREEWEPQISWEVTGPYVVLNEFVVC